MLYYLHLNLWRRFIKKDFTEVGSHFSEFPDLRIAHGSGYPGKGGQGACPPGPPAPPVRT